MAVRSVGLGGAALLYAVTLVFFRGRPTTAADAGIFVSVAARLVHGAHLYVGVWDNKSPFFYYAQAVATDVAGWRGLFLLDVGWLFVATVSMWLLLRAICVSTWVRVLGTVLYPLLLTGAWYVAGFAELPPLALATAMAWLCFRGSLLATGAVLAIAIFLRLDYGLIFLSVIGATIIGPGGRGDTLIQRVSRLLVSFLLVAGASVAVLAARGELTGYISTITGQLDYPNRALAFLGEPSGVTGHLKVVADLLFEARQRSLLLAVVILPLAVALVKPLRGGRLRNPGASIRTTPLNALFVFTGAASAVTLGLTALWGHSLELIALPATFSACIVASWIASGLRHSRWQGIAIAAGVVVCTIAFGGATVGTTVDSTLGARQGNIALSAWWREPHSLSATALNTEARTVRDSTATVTYARLGQNDDGGHAEFTSQDLKLVCPVFHQYPFSYNLTQALACIQRDLPRLVLVSSSFHPYDSASTRRWDAFVVEGERLLHAHYKLALTRSSHDMTVAVWKKV